MTGRVEWGGREDGWGEPFSDGVLGYRNRLVVFRVASCRRTSCCELSKATVIPPMRYRLSRHKQAGGGEEEGLGVNRPVRTVSRIFGLDDPTL